MTTPTVNVTVTLESQDGVPYVGITVKARLDINEVYQGIVIADTVEAVTNAAGVAVLACFPNAPAPTGLGTMGSTYTFRATITGGRRLDVQARVPNANCNLQDILVDTEPVVLSTAEMAALAAQGYAVDAAASASGVDADAAAAVAAASAASTSATSASGSATAAGASATAAAGSATTAAGSATAAAGSATSASGSATTATTQAATATTQAGLAATAKTAAEAARDAALAAGAIYANTAAGLAATASGGYFLVPSPVSTESVILYLDNAGVAVEVKRYPAAVIVARDVPGYGLVIGSSTHTAIGLRLDGTLDLPPVNGPVKDHAERHGGRRLPAQIIHGNGAGQSNGYLRSPAVTTSQQFDNVQFAYKATSPALFDKAVTTGGETPTYGTMGGVKTLLLEEDGLTWQLSDFQLCFTVNAVTANTIDQLSSGGSSGAYEAAVSQVTSGLALATSLGKTFASGGSTWTQGEADAGMAEATYQAKLVAYAAAYNTAVKAITGQTFDAPLITWQVGSNTDKSVAVAQWKAAQEHPLIYMACPAYQFNYFDNQHVTGSSSKWLGGYYGMAWKRIVVDRVGWEPLQPVSVQIVGNNIDVTFNKDGLALDTTLMPTQTQSGFTVDNAGANVAITSVTVMPGRRVRLALGSTPAAGWKVRYGHNAVTGKSPYVGGGGNLRDTQMWTYAGNPMHNWCVIFDWTI